MDFGEGKWIVGRKRHRCVACQGPIPKGENHYHQTGMWEGEWQDWRAHRECHDAWAADGYGEIGDCGEVPDRVLAIMVKEQRA